MHAGVRVCGQGRRQGREGALKLASLPAQAQEALGAAWHPPAGSHAPAVLQPLLLLAHAVGDALIWADVSAIYPSRLSMPPCWLPSAWLPLVA